MQFLCMYIGRRNKDGWGNHLDVTVSNNVGSDNPTRLNVIYEKKNKKLKIIFFENFNEEDAL